MNKKGRWSLVANSETIAGACMKVAGELVPDMTEDLDQWTLLVLLNGGLPFAADLMAALHQYNVNGFTFDTVKASSYTGPAKSGPLTFKGFPEVEGRNIVLVDDIYDSVKTLEGAARVCQARGARKIRGAVLFDKREGIEASIPRSSGLYVPRSWWLVGYGMDLDGAFRGWPEVMRWEPEAQRLESGQTKNG